MAERDTLTTVSATDAWKVKRIRRNLQVDVVACDIRGKVAPGAHPVRGTATLLAPSETETARRLLSETGV